MGKRRIRMIDWRLTWKEKLYVLFMRKTTLVHDFWKMGFAGKYIVIIIGVIAGGFIWYPIICVWFTIKNWEHYKQKYINQNITLFTNYE